MTIDILFPGRSATLSPDNDDWVTGVDSLEAVSYMPQQDTGTAEQYEAEKLLDVTTPRRYHSGEIDHMGSISKCRDAMMRTLLFEAA